MAISPEKSKQITERRRRDILDAAIVLFEENGFEKTRIQDIADRANVSKGLVYRYFPSKDAIFQEIYNNIMACITGELYKTAPAGELLGIVGHKVLSGSGDAETLSSLRSFTLAFMRGDLPQGMNADFIREQYAREYLAPAILRGQEAGEVVPGDPQALARTYWSALLGILLLHGDTEGVAASRADVDATVDSLVSLFLLQH